MSLASKLDMPQAGVWNSMEVQGRNEAATIVARVSVASVFTPARL